MNKPTSNFRLNKAIKTLMGSITDKNERDIFKNAMIEAQLCAEMKPTSEKKGKND